MLQALQDVPELDDLRAGGLREGLDGLRRVREGGAHAGLEVEELHGLYLDRRRTVVARRTLTRGSHAFTIVDPRQIYRVALQLGASAVILAHNHPSDDPEPSPQDIDVTARVARAGRVLGVPLLDHLVITRGRWTSLAALGHVPVTAEIASGWTSEGFSLPGPYGTVHPCRPTWTSHAARWRSRVSRET
ncbi:MAG: JAB domain-containing protein [Myxococcales bacterium]|nr:JAB domain-containing protein [Myxococcales bacterium]